MIDKLRQQLKKIENNLTFNGRPYPKGIVPFPKTLIGQGFFPGGDGLWREKNKLKEPRRFKFPKKGIMFLGNDFGSLTRFQKLKLHENPPTWWRLRQRLDLAGIPGELGFYTNAYLGLRNDRDALAIPIEDQRYSKFCADFLSYQISIQEPKLIIVLGERPAALLKTVVSYPDIKQCVIQYGDYIGKSICVLIVSHPYSDMRKTPEVKKAEANLMHKSWLDVNRSSQEV